MKRLTTNAGGKHRSVLFALLSTTCLLAHAQAEKIAANFNLAQKIILGVSATLITLMIIHAAVEIAARHRKIMDVWPVLAGAGLIASAAALGALLVS